jgi:hypothetical protein
MHDQYVKSIVRIDRWDGTKWVRNWGSWQTAQGTPDASFPGLTFKFPQSQWSLPNAGYYRVGTVYPWYNRSGVQVGEAWDSLERSDYWVFGSASLSNTGAGQEAYCYIP